MIYTIYQAVIALLLPLSFSNQAADELKPGVYRIMNVQSLRYLKAGEKTLLDCGKLMQDSLAKDDSAIWIIEKTASGYTIKSKLHGKIVDADALATGNDGCRVMVCSRLVAGLKGHQEWRIEKLDNGNYRIRCVAGSKLLRVSPTCINQDGCDMELYEPGNSAVQQWVLKEAK